MIPEERTLPRFTIAAVSLICSVCAAAGDVSPVPGRLGVADLNAMPPAERLRVVLAAFDGRDRQMSNFSYSVRESYTNVRSAAGSRQFMKHARYEMRRLGDALWMHLVDYQQGSADAVRTDGFTNWDGTAGRSIDSPEHVGSRYRRGVIRKDESNNFGYRKLNELLGIRVQVYEAPQPPAAFVRAAASRNARIDISGDQWNGRPVVRVDVREGYDRWTFRLDPERGWMIDRFEHRYEVNANVNNSWEEILGAREVSGVWVPTKAIRRTGTSAVPGVETEITYEVDDFQIGSVKPSDVAISFPSGTEVVDAVNLISYKVLPTGNFELRPLADPSTHVHRVPPVGAVSPPIAARASKLYRDEPLHVAYAAPPPGPRGHPLFRGIALAATGTAAAVALIIWARRRFQLRG